MPKEFILNRLILLWLIALIVLLSKNNSAGQDVLLQNQANVDAFDPGTTLVSGNLTIRSGGFDPITDISNLSNITYVAGTLTIERTRLVDVNAFANLQTVGRDLGIFNNEYLKHIDGFSNLNMIGEDLIINANDSLATITGLSALSSIPGDVKIYSNPLLVTLDGLQNISSVGSIAVTGHKSLNNIQALAGIPSIDGDFIISSNDSLKHLNGLENLTFVGKDIILSGLALTNIAALSNLQTIAGDFTVTSTSLSSLAALSGLDSIGGSFQIYSNPALTDLDGLVSLSQSGAIYIGSNYALKHISGFPDLTMSDGLRITSNYLEDITGFGNLTNINGELYIYGNSVLKSFSGFSNIRTANTVVIGENNLKDLAGLSNLTTVQGNFELALDYFKSLSGISRLSFIGGRLLIWRCNSLLNVNGLSGLTSVGGNIDISQNEDLVNIDSLSSLVSVQGSLSVDGNNVLTDVDGLASLTMVGGSLNITGAGLQNADGLSLVTTVGGSVTVSGSSALSNLNGLRSLVTVGGNFNVDYSMRSIDSLSNLTSIGGRLTILSTRLTDLDGLDNLRTTGEVHIFNNQSLIDITGLRNLNHVDGKFEMFGNKLLTPCCAIKELLESTGQIGGNIKIQGNSTECNSVSEILHSGKCGIVSIYNDVDASCQRESSEPGLLNRRLLVDPGSFIYVSDHFGRIDISNLPIGSYSMVLDTSGPWYTTCPVTRTFDITTTDTFPIIESFALTTTQPCNSPEVSISMPTTRPCFDNQKIYVQACNGLLATDLIDSAFLIVTLDSILTLQSASLPFIELDENTYLFELGDIYPGECITTEIRVKVDCDAILGQSLCIKSELFPVDTCIFDETPQTFQGPPVSCNETYQGSHIEVVGHCMGDSIRFVIRNMTDNAGTCYTPVRLYSDTELLWNDSILLVGNEERTFNVSADGKTFRMEAEQHPDHPGLSRPNATVERCGDLMNWMPGLINAFYLDDADPIVDIFCEQVNGSFDPNDKTGFPLGITQEHLVLPDQLMEYRIRFQNTGTDTAFTVVILDTLDTDLNIFSVVPGVTSHPSTFRMHGSRILEWRFDHILLPDSTTNEAESHGFVTFQVQQNKSLPNGTLLSNQAGIYFDFNEPVITNTTWHVVDDQIQGITTSVIENHEGASKIFAFPNPSSGHIYLVIEEPYSTAIVDVLNVHGQHIFRKQFLSGEIIQFEIENSGLYFIVVHQGDDLETVKVMVNRR